MELEKIDIPYVQVPGGGIFAYINGDSTGKTVLLRSDIDALPILESETNLKNKKYVFQKILVLCMAAAMTATLLCFLAPQKY